MDETHGGVIMKLNNKIGNKQDDLPLPEVVENDNMNYGVHYSLDKQKRWELVEEIAFLRVFPDGEGCDRVMVHQEERASSLQKMPFLKLKPNIWKFGNNEAYKKRVIQKYTPKTKYRKMHCGRRALIKMRTPGKKGVKPQKSLGGGGEIYCHSLIHVIYIILQTPTKYPLFCLAKSKSESKYKRNKRRRALDKKRRNFIFQDIYNPSLSLF